MMQPFFHSRIFIFFTILAAAGLVLYFGGVFQAWGETHIRIAVAGPMSGKNAHVGLAMRRAVAYRVEKMKERKDPLAGRIEILVYDDGNDPARAEVIAREIAERADVLAVIGHHYSSVALSAGPVYKQYGIPAITASATADEITRDNPWFFRNAPANSFQGSIIANYVSHILTAPAATVIFDRDDYGASLAHGFSIEAEKLGLAIKNQWGFDTTAQDADALLESIPHWVIDSGDPGIIFLATHDAEGARIVATLKHFGRDFSFIGADAIASEDFLTALEKLPQERFRKGYYSDGIHAVSSFLPDTANRTAQLLGHDFMERYGEPLSDIDIGYFDAAGLVIDAIGRTLSQAAPPERSNSMKDRRNAIRKDLSERTDPGNAYRGGAGEIYFDIDRNLAKPPWIGRYQGGRLLSAPVQFQPVKAWIGIDNPLEEILAERIFLVNKQFLHRLQVIYAGIDVNAISDLSVENGTYVVDFYLWFRFPGEFDDAGIEFVNAVPDEGSTGPLTLGEPIMAHTGQGVTTRAYRVKGKFKGEFDLRDFPFDEHRIEIRFRHKNHTLDKLIYVPDLRGMRGGASRGADYGFPPLGGWQVTDVLFHQDALENNSSLGLPRYFEQNVRIEYSQFNAVVRIARQSLRFIIKSLLPLFFVLVLIYLSYFIRDFGSRMGLGTGALMTVAFFHLSSTTNLQVYYLVALEYLFFLLYFSTVLSILAPLIIEYHQRKADRDAAHIPVARRIAGNIDRSGRIGQPILIVLFCAWMFWLFG
uniref:Amino acid/amide ABC transporter substrate-binding protein, HAAT family n=1 Tax=Candidatus Kentrum sp. DK TaxID=2126562 RepID=A0A450RV37_9GAMM|nr:MAG: amino acid/amide ABC transporter substrate-binding protein, HAAT family [Candidatus Kentron sp. DK]